MKLIDITGSRFGRLLVVSAAESKRMPSGYLLRFWNCICDCGNKVVVSGNALRSKKTSSCKCWQRESSIARFTTHGMRNRSEYRIWAQMIARCTNINNHAYDRYGGRGICVHESWIGNFEKFLEDVGDRPSMKHSLDRYPDMNGNYEPGNVRWATATQQARNRRGQKFLTARGKTLSLPEWCELIGIKAATVRSRLKYGATDENALFRPVRKISGHYWTKLKEE